MGLILHSSPVLTKIPGDSLVIFCYRHKLIGSHDSLFIKIIIFPVNVPVLIGSDGSIALYMTPAIGILMPGGIAENAIKSLYE